MMDLADSTQIRVCCEGVEDDKELQVLEEHLRVQGESMCTGTEQYFRHGPFCLATQEHVSSNRNLCANTKTDNILREKNFCLTLP